MSEAVTAKFLSHPASRGRTIRLYLVDGSPTGTLTAEIMNWTGKVLVSPRAQLAEIARREELRRTGLYLLAGADPSDPLREIVYVGEGDSVVTRLARHDREEAYDFWTRTIVVVSKDDNLTKAHARYLESRLIQMIREAGRAALANGTAPPRPPLPEPDVADMEFFLAQLQMMLPALGFLFLQPKPSARLQDSQTSASPLFVLEAVGVRAEGREIGDEFVVTKGSTSRKDGVDSWTSYKGLRDRLVAEDRLVDGVDADQYVFAEDVAFSSPSAAASVVLARNTNGRLAWRDAGSGKTYADWQELQLKLAGVEDSDDCTPDD